MTYLIGCFSNEISSSPQFSLCNWLLINFLFLLVCSWFKGYSCLWTIIWRMAWFEWFGIKESEFRTALSRWKTNRVGLSVYFLYFYYRFEGGMLIWGRRLFKPGRYLQIIPQNIIFLIIFHIIIFWEFICASVACPYMLVHDS